MCQPIGEYEYRERSDFGYASSNVEPYARTPGRAVTSAIQRPSSSRSVSTRKLFIRRSYPPGKREGQFRPPNSVISLTSVFRGTCVSTPCPAKWMSLSIDANPPFLQTLADDERGAGPALCCAELAVHSWEVQRAAHGSCAHAQDVRVDHDRRHVAVSKQSRCPSSSWTVRMC